jgi:hypothetical protein
MAGYQETDSRKNFGNGLSLLDINSITRYCLFKSSTTSIDYFNPTSLLILLLLFNVFRALFNFFLNLFQFGGENFSLLLWLLS